MQIKGLQTLISVIPKMVCQWQSEKQILKNMLKPMAPKLHLGMPPVASSSRHYHLGSREIL